MQGGVVPLEYAAGIRHGLVEHQREEIVAEVVMGGDVAPAAVGAVAVQPVQEASERRRDERGPALHGLHDLAVHDHEADERGEVVGAPQAPDIGLPAPHRAAEGGVGVGLRVQHLDRGPQVARRRAASEAQPLLAVDDRDFALVKLAELGEEQPATELLQRAAGVGAGDLVERRDDAGFHGTSLSMRPARVRCPAPVWSGWVWKGTRLSQSRSACQ